MCRKTRLGAEKREEVPRARARVVVWVGVRLRETSHGVPGTCLVVGEASGVAYGLRGTLTQVFRVQGALEDFWGDEKKGRGVRGGDGAARRCVYTYIIQNVPSWARHLPLRVLRRSLVAYHRTRGYILGVVANVRDGREP